jgi:hypothetical protein
MICQKMVQIIASSSPSFFAYCLRIRPCVNLPLALQADSFKAILRHTANSILGTASAQKNFVMISGVEGERILNIRSILNPLTKLPSSKVLLALCESVTSKKDDQSLRDLQDYLEARLLLLKNIPVCNSAPLVMLFVIVMGC